MLEGESEHTRLSKSRLEVIDVLELRKRLSNIEDVMIAREGR